MRAIGHSTDNAGEPLVAESPNQEPSEGGLTPAEREAMERAALVGEVPLDEGFEMGWLARRAFEQSHEFAMRESGASYEAGFRAGRAYEEPISDEEVEAAAKALNRRNKNETFASLARAALEAARKAGSP